MTKEEFIGTVRLALVFFAFFVYCNAAMPAEIDDMNKAMEQDAAVKAAQQVTKDGKLYRWQLVQVKPKKSFNEKAEGFFHKVHVEYRKHKYVCWFVDKAYKGCVLALQIKAAVGG